MALKPDTLKAFGDELYEAMGEQRTIEPLTTREPEITIADAYEISLHMLQRRKAAGETVIGKKIGVSSKAVQRMLNVHQPDFGFLTDAMLYGNGAEMPIRETLIQPRAEGEIAFMLKESLTGPGVTSIDVIRATEYVLPCFEIVDSRIDNWNIQIQDTVADNASCGLFVVGNQAVRPSDVDLVTCGMVLEKNGKVVSTGAGAAALGSPVNCVAWLANTLGEFGITLDAGEIILSGSLVPLEPVEPGDHMRVDIGGIGSASVQFV